MPSSSNPSPFQLYEKRKRGRRERGKEEEGGERREREGGERGSIESQEGNWTGHNYAHTFLVTMYISGIISPDVESDFLKSYFN